MAGKKPQADRLRQMLADQIVEAMIPHISGWVKTLGLAGNPNNKSVPPSTRVTAAKVGIELVTKFMGSGVSVAGEDLLKKIEAMRQGSESVSASPEDFFENEDLPSLDPDAAPD